jgi:hypothetical protein
MRLPEIKLRKAINFSFKDVTLKVKDLRVFNLNSVITILITDRTKIFGRINHLPPEET